LPYKLHIEAGVQTSDTSLWNMFKGWVYELFSVNSSDLGKTPTNVRVENWIGKLDSTQVVSSPTKDSVVSHFNLQDSVLVNDSISNVGSTVPQLIGPIDVPAVITNAVVDYSGYVAIGDVLVNPVTDQAYINMMNAALYGVGF
jgi:hypothetical protein